MAAALGLVLALGAALVHAHEPGVVRAIVTFPSRNEYVVDVTVDAASLLGRLETLAGQPRSQTSQTLTGAEYAGRVESLQQEFMKYVHIRFDGSEVNAVLESVREAVGSAQPSGYPVAPEVRLRIRGRIPADSQSLTWQYDLTYSSYALTLKAAADGSRDKTEWLESGQPSGSFPLDQARARPSRILAAFHFFPLVLGIFPFNRRLRSVLWQSTPDPGRPGAEERPFC